jgi:membrane protein DedA with SNARE-associated domain
MEWAINLLTNLATTIQSNLVLASFLAPFIAADFGILLMGFLSTKTISSIFIPIIFSSIGLILLDSFWYFSVRSKPVRYLKNKYISKKILKHEQEFNKISNKKDQWILFISKFLFGTRALVIMYLSSKKNLTYLQFLKYDGIASTLWVSLLVTTGWFAGKGFFAITSAYKGIQIAAGTLTIIIVTLIVLRILISKKILNQKS